MYVPSAKTHTWTDARSPVPRLWIRSAEVQGEEGDVVRRTGTQQQVRHADQIQNKTGLAFYNGRCESEAIL